MCYYAWMRSVFHMLHDRKSRMELHFSCPVHHRHFSSAAWEVRDRLQVEEGGSGQRRLAGSIQVLCPYCRTVHVFAPEAVACSVPTGAAEKPEGGKT